MALSADIYKINKDRNNITFYKTLVEPTHMYHYETWVTTVLKRNEDPNTKYDVSKKIFQYSVCIGRFN